MKLASEARRPVDKQHFEELAERVESPGKRPGIHASLARQLGRQYRESSQRRVTVSKLNLCDCGAFAPFRSLPTRWPFHCEKCIAATRSRSSRMGVATTCRRNLQVPTFPSFPTAGSECSAPRHGGWKILGAPSTAFSTNGKASLLQPPLCLGIQSRVIDDGARCRRFKLFQKAYEEDQDAVAGFPTRSAGRTPALSLGKSASL